MAEILVKAVSISSPDSLIDRGCYRKGYPVISFPDGHEWGNEERPPKFVVIKCKEILILETLQYLEEEISPIVDPNGKKIYLNRRKFKFESIIVDSALSKDGTLSITKNQLISNIGSIK